MCRAGEDISNIISNKWSIDLQRVIVFLLSAARFFNDKLEMSKNYPVMPCIIIII
jgi:hypothetical protein